MATIYTPKQQRILLIVSLVIIAGFILVGLRQYTIALLGSGIIYVIFRPWFTNLVHKRKWNRLLVTILLILFSVIVIIMPFMALSLLLINRIQYYSQHTDQILGLISKLEKATGIQITDQANVKNLVQQGAGFASRQFPSLLSGTLDVVISLGLLYVGLYFIFMEEEKFIKGLRKYLPFEDDTLDQLGEDLKNMVNANILGQALVSLVQSILTGLTLWIFGVPDAAFWGTVAFFFAFIPILGTPIVWGPAGILMISQGETGSGIGILVVGAIVIINVDNLLRVILARRMGDVHPFITLTGIVLGVPVFGILGLVIGPLLLAYFVVLFKVFEKQNQRLRLEAAKEHEILEQKAKRAV
ncbi:AI-2E family transporter [Larkinella arboricola]|uniref:Putative PurR-regulated permease PerM n=1 Tax=Larkinella arboricola TaxID=643671 RepID=A0A327WR99_LARAB|nr:AI-2E family transporter [Larkinella arboricola]RAJ94440.1 putative PurR-regulated permease PerM [Larkinella arboricola]